MTTAKRSKKEKVPNAPVCQGCTNWSMFENECFFYWELKKECSQFRKSHAQEPGFKQDNELRQWKEIVSPQDQ